MTHDHLRPGPIPAAPDGRRPWRRPRVERLEAGRAEIGSDVVTDVGVTKS